jgi:oligopeptide transport system permease protein
MLISRIISFVFLVTVTFFILRLAPGGPFDTDIAVPKEVYEMTLEKYGMNLPIWKQVLMYWKNVLTGDLGVSFQYKEFEVSTLMKIGLSSSLPLGIAAIIISFTIGISIGIFSCLYNGLFARFVVFLISVISLMPNFILAPLFSWFFGIYLKILPISGWSNSEKKYWILPLLSLSIPHIGIIAQITRNSLYEILRQPFIETAISKGLSTRRVIFAHALKPSLIPVISYLGPSIVYILTGSIIVESIFRIPGIGRYFIHASLYRDYPFIMGFVLFYGFLVIICNAIVDFLYMYLNAKSKE